MIRAFVRLLRWGIRLTAILILIAGLALAGAWALAMDTLETVAESPADAPLPVSRLRLGILAVAAQFLPLHHPGPAPVPGRVFQDCPDCPEMVALPPGRALIGTPLIELGRHRHLLQRFPAAIVAFQLLCITAQR